MTESITYERRVHTLGLAAAALLFLFIFLDQTSNTASPSSRTRGNTSTTFLVTTLCQDKCETDCRHYQTPLQQCYNGHRLFPDDESWNSTQDILDTRINATHFRRSFFPEGRNCGGEATDGFELPYEACVGPFGAPRPWGSFQLLQ